MSKVEIDFNNLKYNLYEILNIPTNSDDVKIKKSFMKIIKNFHPDKNTELEEDIYYHIILANQILLNKESRRKYDDFLVGTAETFHELKNSFKKSIENVDNLFPSKDDSKALFENKLQELNKKHGFSENDSIGSIMERFNKIKQKRGYDEFQIEKEEFKSIDEFNNKFNNNKEEGGKFRDQIVEFKGNPSELSTYVIGENYTNLNDLDKLYLEDSVQSTKYSSLDRAFTLQPKPQNNSVVSVEDRMKEYQNQTDLYKNMKPTDFSTKKFNEWQ
jgi:DnaJ family protein A protein 5